ncbi:hypothetical protein HTZ77_10065 [Nonomuraea sp. SMC257]|uniref:Uncharacterized protein n=1 Tax=Nonomuraea montanisoli TaxID=2741721 RepID=A0A7Y6I4W1_9ACTN|nr:hypothetical protein [Nonomuraea montanisoli]NUW31770.1 hypothetical protein [Nonomuraea montanisoli]
MFLRVAIAVQTLAVLVQAVTAGLLLSSPGGRTLHATTALVVVVAVLVHLVAAIVTRRRAAILPAVAMLVMTLAQVALGVAHVKVLHVPVGVLMFGASLMRLGQVWPSRRVPAAAA